MNKIYHISLLFLFLSASIVRSNAQVSINTLNQPVNTALFIEGGNPIVNTDDVIITSSGNMGLGTLVPKAKLDITGKLFYPEGSPEKDLVLTSDSQGNASWTFMSFASKTAEWSITNIAADLQFSTGVTSLLTGVSAIEANDEIGLTAIDNGFIIPSGRYLFFINGDMDGNEYGVLRLTSPDFSSIYYTVYYGYTLNGTAGYLNVTDSLTCSLHFRPVNPRIQTINSTFFYSVPPYYASYRYKVRLLKLG